MPENEPLRLRLDDAGDLPRRMTGPEELTYAKNFEVACHNYPLDQLDTLLRISNARAVRLDIEMQQVTLHQAVLRRMIAERKQQ